MLSNISIRPRQRTCRSHTDASLKWRPLVVIGAARSGTKFLQSILAASSHCAAISYDLNHVWRIGQSNCPHDSLRAEACTDATMRRIRHELNRLGKLAGGRSDAEVLVEKTVSNALRVLLVDRVLPDAKFVHLVRDGRDVVPSALRCWNARPHLRYLGAKLRTFSSASAPYAASFGWNWLRGQMSGRPGVRVWGPRYPGIAQDVRCTPLHVVCARQWKACVASASEAFEQLPTDRVHTLRYEDLASGDGTVESLCRYAELSDVDRVLSAYQTTVDRRRGGDWRSQMSSSQRDDVVAEIGPTLKDWGYA